MLLRGWGLAGTLRSVKVCPMWSSVRPTLVIFTCACVCVYFWGFTLLRSILKGPVKDARVSNGLWMYLYWCWVDIDVCFVIPFISTKSHLHRRTYFYYHIGVGNFRILNIPYNKNMEFSWVYHYSKSFLLLLILCVLVIEQLLWLS